MRFLFLVMLSLASLSVHAKVFQVADTGITLDAPLGFEKLTKSFVKQNWNKNDRPLWAIGNKTGTTTITYQLKENDISGVPLGALNRAMKTVYDRAIPGMIWEKRKVRNIGGKDWLLMEMTSDAPNFDMHNIILIKALDGKMLLLTISAALKDFEKLEADLRKTVDSIKFTEKS